MACKAKQEEAVCRSQSSPWQIYEQVDEQLSFITTRLPEKRGGSSSPEEIITDITNLSILFSFIEDFLFMRYVLFCVSADARLNTVQRAEQ